MNLYTIGYEGLNPEVFLAWLKKYEISVVADVRHLPLSRKAGFSKTVLKNFLNSKDIEYINFRDLGTSKEMRDELYSTKNYKKFFKDYRKLIEGSENISALHQMILDGENITLFCFERDAEICHRKVVADEIKNLDGNGLEITHIKPLE